MMYDSAYGPRDPRVRICHREWEDPLAWVDLVVDAPGQVLRNVAAASARDPRNVKRCAARIERDRQRDLAFKRAS